MKQKENEVSPCKIMESMLQDVADGTATGWRKWYAVLHASKCSRCGSFLDRLKLTLTALQEAKSSQPNDQALDRLREQIRNIAAKQGDAQT